MILRVNICFHPPKVRQVSLACRFLSEANPYYKILHGYGALKIIGPAKCLLKTVGNKLKLASHNSGASQGEAKKKVFIIFILSIHQKKKHGKKTHHPWKSLPPFKKWWFLLEDDFYPGPKIMVKLGNTNRFPKNGGWTFRVSVAADALKGGLGYSHETCTHLV